MYVYICIFYECKNKLFCSCDGKAEIYVIHQKLFKNADLVHIKNKKCIISRGDMEKI